MVQQTLEVKAENEAKTEVPVELPAIEEPKQVEEEP